MDILFTFTGFHDPYTKGLIEKAEQTGPILSLVAEKTFNRIILFNTPNTKENTKRTSDALNRLYPHLDVKIIDFLIEDPTDYVSNLRNMRILIPEICSASEKVNYFISVASGTPQMHACWILLAASGEIPAHILHVRPPRFATKSRPIVSEVDFTSHEFPIVRANFPRFEVDELSGLDLDNIMAQLGIIGDHPLMRKAIEESVTLSSTHVPIIILGETGTGKELIARLIHRASNRALDPFVAINCGAIPDGIVESFLFGHKKGAFTSAFNNQVGKFDTADGGTLFLDEIAELSLPAQARLLRVLQDGLIEPVGGKKYHKVDVRIIAATNKDLKGSIREGKFREDLYYRLNVGEIILPSLRQRKSDIPKISLYILDKINAGLRRPKCFSPDALLKLQNHSWKGNVRDLENIIERSAILSRKDDLGPDEILITERTLHEDEPLAIPDLHNDFSLTAYLNTVRNDLITRALQIAKGNKSEAARLLDLTPQALHKYLKKHPLESTQVEKESI